jgi:hypothetical protein
LMSITSNRHGLFVAGGATTPDNVQLGPVMHWNGEAWRSLGGSPIAWIRGLMALGDDVYAVGQFDSIGGTTARNIAVWNGERWNALGDGVDMGPFGSVAAITVWRDDIVVGGSPAVGTLPNLARFDLDARTWLPMPHLDGFVNALTTVGDDLYLTGYFDVDGSQHIARYDGTTLTGLGSGLNAQGYALAADRTGKLHVGGMFTAAGGKDAYAFSRWNGITLSIDEARAPHGLSIVVSPNVVDAATTLAYTLERAADVHISLADESGRVVATLADGRVEAGRHTMTVDTRALASGAYFLRMIVDGTTSTVPVKVLR